MRLNFYFALLTIGIFLPHTALKANNIDATNVVLTGQVSGSHTFVHFDLAWENSWRLGNGPSNWDAAWVFVKYKITGGPSCTPGNWEHATLNTTGSNHNDGGNPVIFSPSSDGKGVFVHRNANGTGNVDWDDLELRWDYITDGLGDNCDVVLKVFAVEMVHIPTDTFEVGDFSTSMASLEDSVSGNPFEINSEAAITLGGGTFGSLGNNNNPTGNEDFDDATSQTLPAAFPKGYDGFYILKYEVSQEQYVDFLNTLTGTQQSNRTNITVAGNYFADNAAPVNRNGIKCQTLPVGATPGIYVCDLNDNDVGGENGDGMDIACNFINYSDGAAYLDWAGLRPLTELEYEKAARGNQLPVPGEYAWGNPKINTATYALSNAGQINELTASVDIDSGNARNPGTFSTGPIRCGIFATASSNRTTSGGSYYGAMQLSGNLGERYISIAALANRTYTGLHGDGSLEADGTANEDFWPGVEGNANPAVAGSAFSTTGVTAAPGVALKSVDDTDRQRTSDRNDAFFNNNNRDPDQGFRGGRTAP